jgi:hypothetical protein
VSPPVASWFTWRSDFLRMESKPFCLHITEGANNHIKQSDSIFFARNPIGVTDDRLSAMLTIAIHNLFVRARNMPYARQNSSRLKAFGYYSFFLKARNNLWSSVLQVQGIAIVFMNFCKEIIYNSHFVTFADLSRAAVRIEEKKGIK